MRRFCFDGFPVHPNLLGNGYGAAGALVDPLVGQAAYFSQCPFNLTSRVGGHSMHTPLYVIADQQMMSAFLHLS